MSWFNGNKRMRDAIDTTETNSSIEIVAHQKATKEQIKDVIKANETLNKVFAKKHFTLTIYVAAGGKDEVLTTKEKGETEKNWKRIQ